MARRKAAATEAILPVAGALPRERADWIAEDTGLPWLDELRERHHLPAVAEFGRSVEHLADIERTIEDAPRAWRRAVRDAVAVGSEPPPKDFDGDTLVAQREVAEEDVLASREALAEVCVTVLTEARRDEHLKELATVSLPVPFCRAVGAGPAVAAAGLRARWEAKLSEVNEQGITDIMSRENAHLGADERTEILSDNPPDKSALQEAVTGGR